MKLVTNNLVNKKKLYKKYIHLSFVHEKLLKI